MEKLETLVNSLFAVENVPFIENVKRRTQTGVNTDGTTATTSIVVSVRNAAGDGSTTVTKAPDVKLKIIDLNGNDFYLPAFNS